VGASPGALPNIPTPGVSGSLATSTAVGTTQGLVSVDALEEFRVQSSTYSAEHGRNPGGQFSFVTRSGTNQWHGAAFDYLRNDFVDANDWFNTYLKQPEPPLRQNDFGGTLGGPIEIPRLFYGTDRTFFFFSYEGLRLLQPQAASLSFVPTAALRQAAATALQPVLNAFPKVNCTTSTPSCVSDFGNGVGEFAGSWSNPSQIDSESVRFDHSIGQKLRFFFRFGNTSSFSDTRPSGALGVPSEVFSIAFTTRTYTFGMSNPLSSRLGNEFRLNYSSNDATSFIALDSFGGAQAVDVERLQGVSSPASSVALFLFFDPAHVPLIAQNKMANSQTQWNFVHSLSFSSGRHQFKFGFDYRRLSPVLSATSPSLQYFYISTSSVQSNSVDFGSAGNAVPAYPLYTNFSAFGQDEWHLAPRLTLSLGLRWEVNPAPGSVKGNIPYTLQGDFGNPASLSLAPQGTRLWHTTWYNFAPRLGVAYVLRDQSGWETVVRGGGGVFFDTGQQAGSQGYAGVGFSASQSFGTFAGSPASFPATQFVPAVSPPMPPYNTPVYAFPSHLQLPYTLQWNASVQQSLRKSQALTLSYVGANGRRLLEQNIAIVSPNFSQNGIFFVQNGLTSNYHALQTQYQRRLVQGLQALASYTWSHSIDYGSLNAAAPPSTSFTYVRGNSDFDVRHNFAAAVSYDLPNPRHGKFADALLHHWGIDDRFTARTAFPVNLAGRPFLDPVTMKAIPSQLNIVPGQPIYVYGSECAAVYANGLGCPGGRAINPAAFSPPPSGTAGDAPRNFARGFGAVQMDLAVQREIPIFERLRLQFRAEAFNVFNHPNFGLFNTTYCSPNPSSPNFSPGCTFGQASATLAQSLGVLSPLYQAGGPRSMQFALKLAF